MTKRLASGSPLCRSPLSWYTLIAPIAAISVAGIGFGHSLPLFSVSLKGIGASDFVIGLSTAISALAALIATPFYPFILVRTGLRVFLLLCLSLMIIAYLTLFAFKDTVWLWFPLRFALGLGNAGLFVGSEIWLNRVAPTAQRGRVIGIYSTFLAAGFAAGPLILLVTGYTGFLPWLAGASLFALAGATFFFSTAPKLTEIPRKQPLFFPLLWHAPGTFLSTAIFAAGESALFALLPAVILTMNSTLHTLNAENHAALVITVFGVGLLASQYFIGRSTDRIGAFRMLVICSSISFLGALLLPFGFTSSTLLFLVLFVWGGAMCGLQTIGLTLLGDHFQGPEIARAHTALTFMYALGMMIGPVLAGGAMAIFGTIGLPIVLAFLFGGYTIFLFFRRHSDIL